MPDNVSSAGNPVVNKTDVVQALMEETGNEQAKATTTTTKKNPRKWLSARKEQDGVIKEKRGLSVMNLAWRVWKASMRR